MLPINPARRVNMSKGQLKPAMVIEYVKAQIIREIGAISIIVTVEASIENFA
jgi:hypothetical protein